jgi:two-component system chemotaxis response regulator CheB
VLPSRIEAVVVGTSAGGVEALSVLLPQLPAAFTRPVFVVIHLPRERPSLLADIFGHKCALTVREAQDKEPVEGGTIYFAPPDYHLLVDEGPALVLSADELVNFSRPSVDVLFESAAECYGNRLVGIVLTGASHDGAAGLAAVRRAGGVTVVQQPDEAQSPVMVQAALAQGPVDFVLPLAQIADLLNTLDRGDAR